MFKFFLSFLRKQETTAPGSDAPAKKRIPAFAGMTGFLFESGQKNLNIE
ncbi:Uncharacterized protein dnm_087920 [Desulfonema magnum]|uniref:Uncharacterized protein n=1 Tax=Desulfonema magnum TaxID=45655 RepID=A0A975BWP9_9BACT|nr:Uncharacterized protein dnm_087920 [Desulfonema magnum]